MRSLVCAFAAGAMCIPLVPGGAQNHVRCDPKPPGNSKPFQLRHLDSLTGRFELVLIRTIPEEYPDTTSGSLELWRQDTTRHWRYLFQEIPDSVRRARPELARYLGGSFEMVPADTSTWWWVLASRNREYPGVEWYFGRLRLGSRDVLDGTGNNLTIEWVTATAFGGRWENDPGIAVIVGPNGPLPNAEGHFCARRLGV